MKGKDCVKITSVILALFSIGICVFIWGQVSGFEKGYFYGVFSPPPSTGFSASGPNFFQEINILYFILAVGFCIYSIGNLLKPSALSSTIRLLSLIVPIYPLWRTLSFKKEVLAMETKFSYDYWLNNSIYFDYLLLFIASILILFQVALIISNKLDIEKIDIK